MKIFQIGSEFQALYELAETLEFDVDGNTVDNSESLSQLFNELESELSSKLDNTAYIIKELASAEQSLKDEAKRLTEKAKVLANRQERLKELMKLAIESSGQSKVKTDKFNFSVTTRMSPDYSDINMFGLADEFKKVKEELDKTKIKEFVKAGGTIDGYKEFEKTSLGIR
jgi:hypothetical protein